MNTVSIIMPLCNSEQYVAQAINSVIDQTYPHWELLCIDDCSTDQSANIVERFVQADSRIHLLRTDHPSGSPVEPRNIGIKEAKGRFIAFLDSDDMWLPNKLEEQLPLFNDPETVIVFSHYRKLREQEGASDLIVTAPERVNYHQLLKGNVIGNLTGIYDTRKIEKQYYIHVGQEDYVYWLHILRQGGFAVNTRKLHGIYRIAKGSLSHNKFKMFHWNWYIYRHVEHLSLPYAIYCFINYAIRGTIKYFK